MVKNHNPPAFLLPPNRGDVRGVQVGWGQFCTMLKYKTEREGKIYLEVDRFFPSSKTCHVCLNQIGSLPLEIRSWTCNSCNTTHDRDINAAISLRDEGLRLLTCGTRDKAMKCGRARQFVGGVPPLKETVEGGGFPHEQLHQEAYCPDVRPNSGGRKKSTTRQSAG